MGAHHRLWLRVFGGCDDFRCGLPDLTAEDEGKLRLEGSRAVPAACKRPSSNPFFATRDCGNGSKKWTADSTATAFMPARKDLGIAVVGGASYLAYHYYHHRSVCS